MTSLAPARTLRVALIGNPNTGKSTLFNAISGRTARTGNYPGVTVEKLVGSTTHDGQAIDWIDLPGTYSLVPRSPDEWVAVDVLVGRIDRQGPPDAVLCVVDASNLERNLFLVTQLLDLELPIVMALNKTDLAERQGITIDPRQLAERLGVPVIATEAHRKLGVERIAAGVIDAIARGAPATRVPFPEAFETQDARLAAALASLGSGVPDSGAADSGSTDRSSLAAPRPLPRFLRHRLLLDADSEATARIVGPVAARDGATAVAEGRRALAEAAIHPASVEAVARYGWIGERLQGVVRRSGTAVAASWNDRLDRVLVHKVWGTLTLVLLLGLVFQAIFAWAEPLMGLIETVMGSLGEFVAGIMPDGILESLLVDGVIAGVGGVLVFLPQILILFFFLGILEDCGYMARAAFLMDRVMARVGLNGKAFIPLLSSFACAIPGIMATRTIENRRDRLITILVAPLMSCSARLPVYFLLTSAFIPDTTWLGGTVGLRGLTVLAMYLLGTFAAVAVALLLRRTLLKGENAPFLMELPPFKFPGAKIVLSRMWERGSEFVRRAGTLILAVTILVWAAASFPVDRAAESAYETRRAEVEAEIERGAAEPETLDRLDQDRQAERMRESALGRAGIAIEPVVRPLGWDWRIGCAAIASFPAREVVVGTLGVLYRLGSETDEESEPLRDALRRATWDGTDRPVYTIPTALSLMVFFALCAQCSSTLVVIRRETGQTRWAVFAFVYMTALAYAAALATYQIGSLL